MVVAETDEQQLLRASVAAIAGALRRGVLPRPGAVRRQDDRALGRGRRGRASSASTCPRPTAAAALGVTELARVRGARSRRLSAAADRPSRRRSAARSSPRFGSDEQNERVARRELSSGREEEVFRDHGAGCGVELVDYLATACATRRRGLADQRGTKYYICGRRRGRGGCSSSVRTGEDERGLAGSAVAVRRADRRPG